MNKSTPWILVGTLLATVLAIVTIQSLGSLTRSAAQINARTLAEYAQNGGIAQAIWQDNTLRGELKDGSTFVCNVPNPSSAGAVPIQQILQNGHVPFEFTQPSVAASAIAVFAMPILLLSAAGLSVGMALFFLMKRERPNVSPAISSNHNEDTAGQIALLERALGQAHLEIKALQEALAGKGSEGLSS